MGVLETVARIVQLGGAHGHAAQVAAMREAFEQRTGAFSPDDPWFEERSRAFWCDAVTRGGFGRRVQEALTEEERAWLSPLERAHRGLFRVAVAVADAERAAETGSAVVLVDAWSGAELLVGVIDEASRAEVDAAAEQLFDARIVARADPFVVALLPGAVFHPGDATPAIERVLSAARAGALSTHETLDALLRMNRTLRSLPRVKPAYAYRPEALSRAAPALPHAPHPAVRPREKAPR